MLKSPCIGCDRRMVRYDDEGKAHTCHGGCAEYEAFRDRKNKEINARKEEVEAIGAVYSSITRVKKRINWYGTRKHSMKG